MARALSLPFSGAKLLALREAKGWRQEDLSNQTADRGKRVRRDRITLYETGRAVPSVMTFRALVQALGCKEHDLLDPNSSSAAAS